MNYKKDSAFKFSTHFLAVRRKITTFADFFKITLFMKRIYLIIMTVCFLLADDGPRKVMRK